MKRDRLHIADLSSILNLRSFVIGIAFSAVFIYLAFQGVGVERIVSTDRRIDPSFLALGLVVMLAGLVLRAYRWYELLRPAGEFSTWRLFQYNTLGWAMNFVLPVRSGEVIKAIIAAERENRPISFMMGTIGVLRILDVVTLFVILIMSVSFLDVAVPLVVIYLGVVLVTAGIVVIVVVSRLAERLGEDTFLFGRFDFGTIAANVRLLSEGLAMVRSGRQVLVTLLLSFAIWGVDALAYYVFLRAFGITLGFVGTSFLLSITSLGIALPSTAGHIGNFQYFATLALTTLGFEKVVGLGFSIFLHATQYLAVVLFGVPLIIRHGGELVRLLRQAIEVHI